MGGKIEGDHRCSISFFFFFSFLPISIYIFPKLYDIEGFLAHALLKRGELSERRLHRRVFVIQPVHRGDAHLGYERQYLRGEGFQRRMRTAIAALHLGHSTNGPKANLLVRQRV